ncbi:MAG: rod shape-determining protein [Candidatus Pacebacteria bacterium]|nr:rod shape-determining protein [Candidatus Paceibacterota bacterium]
MNVFSKVFERNKFCDDYFISLDIGSETIKALVLRIDKKREKVFIIGVGQENQKQSNMQGSEINNVSDVVFACKKAINIAVMSAKVNPTKVIIGMNEEFIKSMTVNVNYTRKNPRVKISAKETKDIICKTKNDLFADIKKGTSKDEISNADVIIASSIIADIRIDGYGVMSPVGFKGNKIELKIFNSVLSSKNLKIIKYIAKKLSLDVIDVLSEPYAVAISMGIRETVKFNAILVDMGSKATSVAVVSEGNVSNVKIFNVGGMAFTKSLADEFNLEFSKAEKLKIKYSNKQIQKELFNRIKKIFDCNYDIMLTGVKLSLKELSGSNLLPTQILFYGGASQLLDISKVANKLFFEKEPSFLLKMKSSFVNSCDIVNVVDNTGMACNLQYVNSISLASFVFDLAVEEDFHNKILRNMIKMNFNK